MATIQKRISEIYGKWGQQKLTKQDKSEYYFHLSIKRQYNLEMNRTKRNLVKLTKCLETIQELGT